MRPMSPITSEPRRHLPRRVGQRLNDGLATVLDVRPGDEVAAGRVPPATAWAIFHGAGKWSPTAAVPIVFSRSRPWPCFANTASTERCRAPHRSGGLRWTTALPAVRRTSAHPTPGRSWMALDRTIPERARPDENAASKEVSQELHQAQRRARRDRLEILSNSMEAWAGIEPACTDLQTDD